MSDTTQDVEFACPKCDQPTEHLFEGCCEQCRDDQQRLLDIYNAAYDDWMKMSDSQRDALIRGAMRNA